MEEKMKRWFVVMLLIMGCILMCLPGAMAASGTAGAVSWNIDDNGTLIISGNGEIPNYSYRYTTAPWGSNGIKSIIIEEGVTRIGNYAFYNISAAKSIAISSTVQSIGSNAFQSMGATTIIIPEGVEKLDDFALSGAYAKSIILPDSLKSIGESAFSGCSNLIELVIPGGVETVPSGMCQRCSLLSKITLSEGITSIGTGAFQNCNQITSFSFPSTLKEIGENAFYSCTNVSEYVFPNTITSIGTYAFYGSNGVRYCSIGSDTAKSLGTIGSWFVDNDYPELTMRYDGEDLYVVGRSEYKDATKIVIPEEVTVLDHSAFADFSKLRSISIPKNVTQIMGYTFDNCTSLEEIEVLGNVGVFDSKGLTSLKKVHFARGVQGYFDKNRWGNCGENVYYKFSTDGSIVISGQGDMWDEESETIFTTLEYPTSSTSSAYASVNDVLINEGVTSIGDRAFRNCSSLNSVSIPNTVTRIGYDAFGGTGLTSLSIPDSVRIIDDYCFNSVPFLKSVVLPDGLEQIGDSAFYRCRNLTSVTIPKTVKKIGKQAFDNCEKKPDIVGYFDSILEIGEDAFKDCQLMVYASIDSNGAKVLSQLGKVFKDREYPYFDLQYSFTGEDVSGLILLNADKNLTRVEIPKGITSIDEYAFSGCYNLKEIQLPESLVEVSRYAFQNCNQLKEIVLPSKLASIGEYAFTGCGSIQEITIGENTTTLGARAFNGCSGLTNVTIVNPDTHIGEYAFASCTELSEITVPGNLTNVEKTAFASCVSLKSIIFSSDVMIEVASVYPNLYRAITIVGFDPDVEGIGEAAFRNCTSIVNVTLPENGSFVEKNAFYGCSSLENISFSDKLQKIGDQAFMNCSSLVNALLPNSIISMGKSVFAGCTSLTEAKLPSRILSVGESMFRGCSGLETFSIPEQIETIEKNAFYNCSGLTEVIVQPSVKSIGNYAFAFCDNLSRITLPGGLQEVSPTAFTNCIELKDIILTGDVSIRFETVYPDLASQIETLHLTGAGEIEMEAFSNCKGLKHVIISEGITAIGAGAFQGDTSLLTVSLPDSVTEIEANAFAGCHKIKEIKVPMELISLGSNAFEGCETLERIDIFGQKVEVGEGVFANCNNLMKVSLHGDMRMQFKELCQDAYQQIEILEIGPYVETISDYAFEDCAGLKEILLPESIVEIGEGAWKDCINVTTLNVSGSINNIALTAFDGCEKLVNLVIRDDLIYRIKAVFPGIYQQLSSVALGSNVTKIVASAFIDCKELKEITVDDDNYAFYVTDGALFDEKNAIVFCLGNMEGTYIIPEGTAAIYNNAFSNCEQLDYVKIPASVINIGNSAFDSCDAVLIVNCGSYVDNWAEERGRSIELIHDWHVTYAWAEDYQEITATRNCQQNEEHTDNETVSSYIQVVASPTDDEEGSYVYISSEFENEAFEVQQSDDMVIPALSTLDVLRIPAGLGVIEDEAFVGINAQAIIIPNGCESIGKCAFAYCEELRYVYIPETVTSMAEDAFEGCTKMIVDRQ